MSAGLLAELTRPDVVAAIIGAVATILVGTVGALVVVWQIGQQARLAIAQNTENEAVKLKLRVYEEVSEICRRASDAQITLSTFVRGFASSVSLIHMWQRQGVPWSLPKERTPSLMDVNRDFEDGALEVIFATERWQIIDPRIDLFRYAVNAALHDAREAYHTYFQFAVTAMPTEIPAEHGGQGKLFPWRIPDLERTHQLSDRLTNALGTCGSYFGDMHVEMQNLLIGDLFGNRVPAREPLDPKFVAVRLDRYDALKVYFETQTPWGRNAQRVLAEVRDRVAREAKAANQAGPEM